MPAHVRIVALIRFFAKKTLIFRELRISHFLNLCEYMYTFMILSLYKMSDEI